MARLWTAGSWKYLSVPDHADLDATTALTVMAWIYPTNADSLAYIHVISKWQAYCLRLFNDAGSGLYGWDFTTWSGGVERKFYTESVPNLNQWWHVAGTYDGVTTKLRVWDSLLQAATNYITMDNNGDIDTNANDLYLGSYQGGEMIGAINLQVRGKLEGVQVWKNVALADAEIDRARWNFSRVRQPVLALPVNGSNPEPDYSGRFHPATVAGPVVTEGAPTRWRWPDVPLLPEPAVSLRIPVVVHHLRQQGIA